MKVKFTTIEAVNVLARWVNAQMSTNGCDAVVEIEGAAPTLAREEFNERLGEWLTSLHVPENKLLAIKKFREIAGVGLYEAKTIVERLMEMVNSGSPADLSVLVDLKTVLKTVCYKSQYTYTIVVPKEEQTGYAIWRHRINEEYHTGVEIMNDVDIQFVLEEVLYQARRGARVALSKANEISEISPYVLITEQSADYFDLKNKVEIVVD